MIIRHIFLRSFPQESFSVGNTIRQVNHVIPVPDEQRGYGKTIRLLIGTWISFLSSKTNIAASGRSSKIGE